MMIFLHQYFKAQKESSLYDNNPVYSFIKDRDDYTTDDPKSFIKFCDFKQDFKHENKGYKLQTTDMVFL